jgi:hypothetical protein
MLVSSLAYSSILMKETMSLWKFTFTRRHGVLSYKTDLFSTRQVTEILRLSLRFVMLPPFFSHGTALQWSGSSHPQGDAATQIRALAALPPAPSPEPCPLSRVWTLDQMETYRVMFLPWYLLPEEKIDQTRLGNVKCDPRSTKAGPLFLTTSGQISLILKLSLDQW